MDFWSSNVSDPTFIDPTTSSSSSSSHPRKPGGRECMHVLRKSEGLPFTGKQCEELESYAERGKPEQLRFLKVRRRRWGEGRGRMIVVIITKMYPRQVPNTILLVLFSFDRSFFFSPLSLSKPIRTRWTLCTTLSLICTGGKRVLQRAEL